jgi:hypothetical protein
MAQAPHPVARGAAVRSAPHALVQSGAVRRLALSTVVSLPTDPAEREAVEVSQRVMRMTAHAPSAAPAVSARPGAILSAPFPTRHPAAAHMAGTAEPDIGQEIRVSLGSGVPLPPAVQAFMAPRFHTDFAGVRIHATPQAAHLATRLQARAFTYRNHIFFGQNEFRPETQAGQALIAHELTHTIQQSDVIQREEGSPGIVDSVTGALKSAWSDITDFTDEVGWKLVRSFAPSLEPLINKGPDGIFDWLKERAGAAVDGMFNVITAPVRAVGGAGQQLAAQFQPLVATVEGAVGKIARNDCSPLREAAEEIEHVATELVTPVIEKVQPIVAAVKKVAGELWDKVGAPVLDVIKEYAAEKWQEIQTVWGAIKAVASAIWDKTAWARDLIGKAWTWLKNKLGIGEGAEGENGLLQWAERKLDSAWTWLKNLLAPFSRQLTIIGTAVGGVLIALSPAGPVLAIGAGIAGAAKGLQWISANWGQGNLIVQSRAYLEKTLIPPLVAAATSLGGTITRMATSINGALHGLATGVAEAARALGGEVLAALAAPIQWVADQITALADWATGELGQVSKGLTGALHGLQTFLQNMLEFFGKVGGVVLDIYLLPLLLGGKIWNWIPACIRDPIVDFLGPIILQQIELFSELGKDKEAWLKTKAEIGNLIKLVFKDHDLVGAVKAGFNLVLRVFNLPPDLLATVAAKAMAAWDTISKKPLDFLKNTVRSLGRGFALLWKNFGSHLKFGLEGWLFGGLKEKNISPPASWTDPKELFFFVLEVLGLSVDHVFDLLKQRFPPERVEALRKWYGRIGRVVDWINKTIDVNKSPAENTKGLIDQAKDFGTSILTSIATWVTTKVGEELAILAASAAASAGLSEVLDVARRIYKALVTAKRWARQLLDMANNTLDNIMEIAGGAVEKVGTKFEGILHRGMPMVIGFLADQVGLGGIGEEMRTIVDKLRGGVDKGILWLIDKVKAALAAVVGAVKAGAVALGLIPDKIINTERGSHRMFVAPVGGRPMLKMQSAEMTAGEFLRVAEAEPSIPAAQKARIPDGRALVATIDSAVFHFESEVLPVRRENHLRIITSAQERLGKILQQILKKTPITAFDQRYLLEGYVATYGSLEGLQTRDFMEPDHMPQYKLMINVAGLPPFAAPNGVNIRAATIGARGSSMQAINLHKTRHSKGRTYGNKPAILSAANGKVNAAIIAHPGDLPRQAKAVVQVLNGELVADVAAMRNVIGLALTSDAWSDLVALTKGTPLKPATMTISDAEELRDRIKHQIDRGLDRMVSQPMNRYET